MDEKKKIFALLWRSRTHREMGGAPIYLFETIRAPHLHQEPIQTTLPSETLSVPEVGIYASFKMSNTKQGVKLGSCARRRTWVFLISPSTPGSASNIKTGPQKFMEL